VSKRNRIGYSAELSLTADVRSMWILLLLLLLLLLQRRAMLPWSA
jgi:hypothetical protein